MNHIGSNITLAQIKTEPPVETCINEPSAHTQHVSLRDHHSLSYSCTSHDRTGVFPQSPELQQSQTQQPPHYSPAKTSYEGQNGLLNDNSDKKILGLTAELYLLDSIAKPHIITAINEVSGTKMFKRQKNIR